MLWFLRGINLCDKSFLNKRNWAPQSFLEKKTPRVINVENSLQLRALSCAATNLKVERVGHTSLSCPSAFWLYKYNISRFGERFRDGQCSWSVSCLLFFYLRCPMPSICKSGGTCPRAPRRRHHCVTLCVCVCVCVWSILYRNRSSRRRRNK